MDYLIMHNNEPIGQVVEPGADSSMGVIIGSLIPFLAYENVRSVFRIYAELVGTGQARGEKLRQYHDTRDVLTRHLSITTINGFPVETLWIDILDFSEFLGDDGYEAHFCVAYDHGIFFSNASMWDCRKEESSS